jgi:hypothetical protein
MNYVIEVKEHGRIVKREVVASSAAAQAVAKEWRSRGFAVAVKTETSGSTPY